MLVNKMKDKKQIIKMLIENGMIDEDDLDIADSFVEVYDDAIVIQDLLNMTKKNLLKIEELLGTKDFYVDLNGHLEHIYVVYKI